MNVNIKYAVILPFHDFHFRGQTNVAYKKICCKTSSCICISGSIFWNLTKHCMNFNIDYAVILLFYDFHLKLLWHMYKYALKHPFRQNIFKQTYWNVVFRYYILTLALYVYPTYASLNTSGIKFLKLIIVWNISNLFLVRYVWTINITDFCQKTCPPFSFSFCQQLQNGQDWSLLSSTNLYF